LTLRRAPDSIVKHCPPQYRRGGAGGNKPPRKPAKKKRVTTAEAGYLRGLALKLIKRLAKYEPDVIELLDQVQPPEFGAEPNDSLKGSAFDFERDAETETEE
jgi:hypothetical protein